MFTISRASRSIVVLRLLSSYTRASSTKAAGQADGGAIVGDYLRIECNGPIAEVVMARPKAFNSVGEGFLAELKDVMAWLDNAREIRAAILRAEGKVFCAGLDMNDANLILTKGIEPVEKPKAPTTALGKTLKKPAGAPPLDKKAPPAQANQELLRMIQRWQKGIAMMQQCRVPIIAAVHSKCIGAGVDIICAADVRVCSADAEFSVRETRVAIMPDLGSLQFLTRLIGSGPTRDLVFTGRDFGAAEAAQLGFVNRVYETEAAMLTGARKLAAEMAANSPLAVQGAKYVFNFAEEHKVGEGLDQMAMWNAAFLKSDDLFAAIAGFATKMKPKFTNTMAPPPPQ